MLANGQVMEKENNNIRVSLENIGEGRCGDYDPDDPGDVNYLRFYVSELHDGDGEWQDLDDASYCTLLPASLSDQAIDLALDYLMEEIIACIAKGGSMKKTCENLSWISPKWLAPSPDDETDAEGGDDDATEEGPGDYD